MIKRTNSDDNDFISLVALLDADLRTRDGEDHAFYAQFNKIVAIKQAVVFYDQNKAVGCGAFKPFEVDMVEIKRMFVHPDARRKGIAAEILNALEMWAKELGYKVCVLETGQKQPEAIALYQKLGYRIIPNYGQYKDVENSVCMKKDV